MKIIKRIEISTNDVKKLDVAMNRITDTTSENEIQRAKANLINIVKDQLEEAFELGQKS